MAERAFSAFLGLLGIPFGQCLGAFNERGLLVGLVELLLIVLVVAAVVGGIGLSPLLWLLLLVALVLFLTGGGFGYRRSRGI